MRVSGVWLDGFIFADCVIFPKVPAYLIHTTLMSRRNYICVHLAGPANWFNFPLSLDVAFVPSAPGEHVTSMLVSMKDLLVSLSSFLLLVKSETVCMLPKFQ